jgi:hypothetical protein
MLLSTDDPDLAPTINSLSVEFEEALVQGALGSISPRQVTPNEDTQFTYTLWPQSDALDSGFDRLRFTFAEAIDPGSVEITSSGQTIAATSVSALGDSLFIDLPQAITDDSLQVSFTARVLANASVFTLDLGSSTRPSIWQSVEAATRRSNIIMLPDLASSDQLIGDLSLGSEIFTPNGDGINDQLTVRFVALKVEGTQPVVEIYDLAGRLVTRLLSTSGDAQQQFSWPGNDASGRRVDPGIYLLRIDLGADSGNDTILRTIAVAY